MPGFYGDLVRSVGSGEVGSGDSKRDLLDRKGDSLWGERGDRDSIVADLGDWGWVSRL